MLPNKKLLVACALCFGVFSILVIIFLSSKLPILSFDNHSQLSQIITIETELLRKWQQNGSLKNNLAYNSDGSDIVLLQRMLAQDSVAYPEKRITGYYGDLTLSAVKNFQREYGLTESGAVDTVTRKKLNEIFFSHLCPEPVVVYPDFLMKKVKTNTPVPSDYVSPLLQDISTKVKTVGISCLRSDVLPNIVQMFADAKIDGVELMITSAYRKPEIQKYLYDFWIQTDGDKAINEIAEPGLSEHQLGTTIDLTDSSINFAGVDDKFANSKGGNWLQMNAYKYGFIMSFPEGKQNVTGFKYEPWHWRFVGIDVATALHEQNLTYNEANFDSNGFPFLKDNTQGIELTANSFLSVFVSSVGNEKILIEKNKDRQLPIASITKLMVALIASERYKSDDVISISENSLKDKGLSGIYKTGDSILFSDALRALLLASHNEIASAMAEQVGTDEFRNAMNQRARAIGNSNTIFVNVTGLDPAVGSEQINHSTVFDIYKLAKYIQENRPDLLSITTRKEFNLFDANGNFIATINNIDKLLGQQNIPFHILGSKTGETPRAKQNLIIVSDSPCGGKIFSITLGSQNSFGDMQKLLWHVHDSYEWTCSP